MITVNQTQIPEDKVLAEMQYHPAESRREAMFKAAESLIIGELFRQRAKTLGIPVSDDTVESSDEDFIEALIEQEVAIPDASEEDCRQYFEANPGKFETSPLLEVKHILLAVPKEDDAGRAEAKMRADALLDILKGGADFGKLAKRESSCPSKETGGSLGQLSKGQTVPEFERQVFVAEPGLMPRPVESRYGFHLVYIERKIPGKPLTFDQAREKIAEYLNEKVRRKAIAQYIQVLIAEAEIEGYDFQVDGSPLMQ
ncbi:MULTISPECIES: peptidylprolyl isomerase [unclassified Marinimicrobium]|jgi:peptidyl-prolyl cis-trans isomerase C|uniref:peptidylprolyl isomerase n=1 Tax=Marinimicrobium TaxID=359337 RepID=UPI000C470FFF|nr:MULTISPECIES: peptidylprolyl isomerase [unclassified Marinimicrobium]MAN50521.1 peptidylprolyl isomerase [Marinimicrobium sp.]